MKRQNAPQIDIDCCSAALEYIPNIINETVHGGTALETNAQTLQRLNHLADEALKEVLKKHIGVDPTKYRVFLVSSKQGEAVKIRFSPHMESVFAVIFKQKAEEKAAKAPPNYGQLI